MSAVRKTKVTTDIVSVTPAMAMKFLQDNTQNRPISRTFVKRFAKAMREGKWQINGESIVFADDGTLLDGQHRLQAILDSGKTISMTVTRGVSKDSFKTIDIGRKRTGADALATYDEKFSKNRGVIAAAITTIVHFGDNGVYDASARGEAFPHSDLIDFAEKNYKQLSRAVEHTQGLTWARKLVPFSCLVALFFLFNRKDPYEAETFFHKLNTGEGMLRNDPVNLLRNRLMEIRSAGGVFRSREVIPYLVKAWELVREGKEVKQLHVKADYIPVVK